MKKITFLTALALLVLGSTTFAQDVVTNEKVKKAVPRGCDIVTQASSSKKDDKKDSKKNKKMSVSFDALFVQADTNKTTKKMAPRGCDALVAQADDTNNPETNNTGTNTNNTKRMAPKGCDVLSA